MGWGEAVGKIFDWFPGRAEARRNKIEQLEREQDALRKRPNTPANVIRLDDIARELGKLYAQAKNSA